MLKKQCSFKIRCVFLLTFLSLPTISLAVPQEFRAVDTSRVIGSPNPISLETEAAFPAIQFQRPVELTFADDTNRLFVVEQHGVVRVFENRPDVKSSESFLDIRDRVSRDGNEEGLLGLAFHPSYRENGQFFVYYSAAKPRRSIVSRFRVSSDDADQADPGSETKLLEIAQPFGNHNGGSIRFGPDGFLYIGLGDGGLAHDPHGNGQDLSKLLGSILRIDVDRRDEPLEYDVPPDNPFVERDEARGEIYAYGFRNVWRLSFDRQTGDLWCGDVGQERYEEIDRVVRGGNYGWKIREGRHEFDPDAPQTGEKLIDPVAEHFHSEGESITGGLVYRGNRLANYRGRYFFADYESGFVWTLQSDGDGWRKDKVANTGLGIAAFGEDRQGEMYLCAFDGKIYRLRPRDIDVAAEAAAFPKKLSRTGLFDSVADHRPTRGIVPYNVNIPFWSDGAVKQRFIALPKAGSVKFHRREKWEFPVGTVFIKTFWLPLDQSVPIADSELRRLETRLFVHGRDGWGGYTYLWNDQQTEAELIDDAVRRDFAVDTPEGRKSQTWHFPSRVECMACHTQSEKFVLGWNTRQMNRPLTQPLFGGASPRGNQIDVFARQNFFTEQPPASEELESYSQWQTALEHDDRPPADADLSRFARAWLDVNCAMCHQPDAIAGKVAGQPIDLRFHTPLSETGIVGRKPGHGQLAPKGSSVLTPGDPARSELLLRISTRGERQMPPLATLREDDEAARTIRRWIEASSRDEGQAR